ncbi:MAG: hypothetical protein M3Y56_03790, partial [Armatimonadota bacterium]|nr:hypothetical protein [Armatimonadota bacterium]
ACRRIMRKGALSGDFVLVARPPALQAEFEPLCSAVEMLISQADQEVLQWMSRRSQGKGRGGDRRSP